jgi:hypothetical protein
MGKEEKKRENPGQSLGESCSDWRNTNGYAAAQTLIKSKFAEVNMGIKKAHTAHAYKL